MNAIKAECNYYLILAAEIESAKLERFINVQICKMRIGPLLSLDQDGGSVVAVTHYSRTAPGD